MSIKFGSREFRDRGGWWVVAQVILFAVLIVSFSGNRTPATAFRLGGLILIGAAIVVGGSAMWMLRDKLTAMPAPAAGAVLHDRGPYALVRHPIYSGVILGFVGLAVRGGNPLAFGLALTLIPFFYAKTSHEERLLVARFPEYADYQARVRRRVIPWVL